MKQKTIIEHKILDIHTANIGNKHCIKKGFHKCECCGDMDFIKIIKGHYLCNHCKKEDCLRLK